MHELKEQMNNMHQDFKSYDGLVKQVLDKVKDERKRQKERMDELDWSLKYFANEFIIYARK